jgi:hypothetical protein
LISLSGAEIRLLDDRHHLLLVVRHRLPPPRFETRGVRNRVLPLPTPGALSRLIPSGKHVCDYFIDLRPRLRDSALNF